MAASYLRILIGVLSGVGLVTFLIGFVIGLRAQNTRRAIVASCVVGIVLLIAMLLGTLLLMRSLGVSGTLIPGQVLAFWIESEAALLCGVMLGRWRKQERDSVLLGAGLGLALLSLIAIGVQVKNAQAVLEILQLLGQLKPKDDYKPETNQDCPENLKKLYNAFEQYAEFNDSLPPAAAWEANSDLTSRIPHDEWLHCPIVSSGHDTKFGYAYNDAVAGKRLNLKGKSLKTLPNAATTPLLYDSTNLNKNAHDAFSSLPKPGRHSGRNNILYLDGNVAPVVPK